jgi:hypothetical protein
MGFSREGVQKSASQLWQDYLFLTREMVKFLEENEIDMFFSLMEQRDVVQGNLDQQSDRSFITSPEGKTLVTDITQLNGQITYKLHYNRNIAKKQEEVNTAYDGGVSAYAPGRRMDWKR